MTEPTPLSAAALAEALSATEGVKSWGSRAEAIIEHLNAARATVPAAEPHKATWYPEAGEWCCPLHARPVPAADDRERLDIDALGEAILSHVRDHARGAYPGAEDHRCANKCAGPIAAYYHRPSLRAGVTPSTGDDR